MSGTSVEVLLVRHGEAAVPWSQGGDSGLSDVGRAQAERVVDELSGHVGRPVVSSPAQRALETAEPFSRYAGVSPRIESAFEEIPLERTLARRRQWLVEAPRLQWHELDAALLAWRERAWQALLGVREDCVVFTHFMLINALVSRACDDSRIVIFEPDYASVTRLRVSTDGCQLEQLGRSLAKV